MALKVYTSGNYIITDTGSVMHEFAKGYTTYSYNQSTQTFTVRESVGGSFTVTRTQVLAGDITDESSVAYTFNSFVTFLRENTGFKTAPGGSGAAPIGATLLKTGQVTSYRSKDDGGIQAGRDVSFFTLLGNNPYGNIKRFLDELGTEVYANKIVIDWSTYDGSTVLGYTKEISSTAVTWNDAIDNASATSLGTYTTNWRLPNVREMQNIVNFQRSFTNGGFNYQPFNISEGSFWTSNTLNGSTANKFYTFNFGFGINFQDQANTLKYLAVRTFTVSGTTLT